jgi:hypothetical protein
MSTPLLVALGLVILLLFGGLAVAALLIFRDVVGRQAQAHSAQIESVLDANRELAHKVSAPEQASIDHLFEKERQRREQQSAEKKRIEVAKAIDRELQARGVELQ